VKEGGPGGRLGLALLLLFAACATEKLHDAMDVDGREIHAGMSAAEVTKLLGQPDFKSDGGPHRHAWRFKHAAELINASWDEWVWRPEDYIYVVVYLSDGTVRKVGVAWDSPVSRSDDLCSLDPGARTPRPHLDAVTPSSATPYGAPTRYLVPGVSYSMVTGISVVNDSYLDDSGSRTRTIAGPGLASLGTLTGPW
jgi:hypothetical protein